MARVARDALLTKYSLLPVLYTLFFIHSTAGETVVRPLWHEFPQDAKTRDIDTQVMNLHRLDEPINHSPFSSCGEAPSLCPQSWSRVLQNGWTTSHKKSCNILFNTIRSAYLPTSAVWYDFYTRQKVIGGEVGKSK